MARRSYSDEQRAEAMAALDANGGNVKRTARETGIPGTTIKGWADGRRAHVDNDLRTQKRGDLADRLEEIAWQLAGALPDKIEGAALNHIATALGITVDKMRLLRGESGGTGDIVLRLGYGARPEAVAEGREEDAA